jgi:hypothetical protein
MTIRRADVCALTILAAGAAIASYTSVVTLDARFFDTATGNDVWFEGDLARLMEELTDRWAAHSRATVHPVWSLFACSGVYLFRAFGFSSIHSVAIVAAVIAACWTAAMYALLKVLRHAPLDAALFTSIALVSAAGFFWLTVPETYAAGSATMLLALLAAGLAECRPPRERWFVIASALTLGVTVTNWMAGILATWSCYPWRRTAQITVNAFVLVVAFWAIQRIFIPHADFFIGYSNEQRYFLRPEAGGVRKILTALAIHSVVMPSIDVVEKPPRGLIMSVQQAPIAGNSLVWRAAAIVWLALLASGVWAAVSLGISSALVRTVCMLITAQIGLHVLYGTETFLYALHFVPLLVILASLSAKTVFRPAAVVLAVALLVLGGVNNARQWREARAFFLHHDAAGARDSPEPTQR